MDVHTRGPTWAASSPDNFTFNGNRIASSSCNPTDGCPLDGCSWGRLALFHRRTVRPTGTERNAAMLVTISNERADGPAHVEKEPGGPAKSHVDYSRSQGKGG
jgi:hypothetical protein